VFGGAGGGGTVRGSTNPGHGGVSLFGGKGGRASNFGTGVNWSAEAGGFPGGGGGGYAGSSEAIADESSGRGGDGLIIVEVWADKPPALLSLDADTNFPTT